MKSKNIIHLSGIAVLSVALGSASHAAIIVQTANHTADNSWNNTVPWGGTAAVAGENYQTAGGFITSETTRLGTGTDITGRLRDTGTTFDGDSLTIVSGTEVLLKQSNGSTSSANLIMDGGILRLAPNSSGSGTVAGTIDVQSNSVIGLERNDNLTMTISSTLIGSGDLRLAGGGNGNGNLLIIFDGNLSSYTGNMDIGGGLTKVTVRLASDYNLPSMTISMGNFTTLDIFDLSNDISIGGFSFGATSLDAGTYTVAELNDQFSTDRFTGASTLTVIPEPSTAILSGLGLLALLRRRRTA